MRRCSDDTCIEVEFGDGRLSQRKATMTPTTTADTTLTAEIIARHVQALHVLARASSPHALAILRQTARLAKASRRRRVSPRAAPPS